MRSDRYLLLLLPLALLALGLGLFYSGKLRGNKTGQSSPFADLLQAPQDSATIALLDKSLARVGPDALQWLQTTLWQRVNMPGLSYESEGKLLLAPSDRFRLELTTRTANRGSGNSSAQLLISDGSYFWLAHRGEQGEWVEDARVLLTPEADTAMLPAPRAGLLPGSNGVAPLLRQLRTRLNWVSSEPWAEGRTRLTGVAPTGKESPGALAFRACRVILENETLWPGRIEWWGPRTNPAQDELLIEMEFRAPILNQPLPLDRCVQEFHLHPSATVVTVPMAPPPVALAIPGPASLP